MKKWLVVSIILMLVMIVSGCSVGKKSELETKSYTKINISSYKVSGENVIVSDTGKWQMLGLVINNSKFIAGELHLTATLYSKSGKKLGTSSAKAMVKNVKPGESAPFFITSKVDAGNVGRVKWKYGTSSELTSISREVKAVPYYIIGYGTKVFHNVVRSDKSYPYLLASGLENEGDTLKSSSLVVAWVNAKGKVLYVASTKQDPNFKKEIEKGDSINFEDIRIDGLQSPSQHGFLTMGELQTLDQIVPQYWVMGER